MPNVGDIVYLKLRSDDTVVRTGLVVQSQHANENACASVGAHWQVVAKLRERNFIVYIPGFGLVGPSPFSFLSKP